VSEAQRAFTVFDFKSNPAKLDKAIVEMEGEMYREICLRYRVYCLSENADMPLMWAHYGASHTGICLEFDGERSPFTRTTGATKVEYRGAYPAYDIETVGYEPLVTKSNDWAYEAEWRLIAEDGAIARTSDILKTDDDFLRLPSDTLKSVIIGALATAATVKRVKELVRHHGNKVLIRTAKISMDRYKLNIDPPIL